MAERCNFVTKPNLGLLAQSKAKLIYWPWLVVKDSTFLQSTSQGECAAYAKKNLRLLDVFLFMLSHFCLIWLFVTLWMVACQSTVTPLSMGFSRQAYWSGLPCLWEIFPTQGLNSHLLHWQLGSLPLMPPGEPMMDFRERFSKSSIKGGFVEWAFWLVSGEVTKWYFGISISIFWVQLVYYPHACVNSFHLVGVLVSSEQLKGMAQNIIYSPCGGMKQSWLWLEISCFILFDCFPVFLHFVTSPIKCSLRNSEKV